jgi:hypothetical protein
MPGFQRDQAYGFEIVAARNAGSEAGDPHQSKIYAESNRSDFLQIFDGLSSMQTLAIYGRLLLRELIA